MKQITLILLCFLPLICISASLYAQEKIVISDLTGNSIARLCTSGDVGEVNFCSAYIEGIRDGITWDAAIRHSKPLFAIPAEVTSDQLKDVVVKYLNDHPQTRHKPAGMLIIMAFKEVFPRSP